MSTRLNTRPRMAHVRSLLRRGLFSGLLVWAVGSEWGSTVVAQTRPAPEISTDVSVVPVVGAAKEGLLRAVAARRGAQNLSPAHHECPGGIPHVQPISCGSTTTDALTSTGSCLLSDGSYFDVYSFDGTTGQQVTISMSASFDTFLFLLDTNSFTAATDDNGGGGTNSRIVYTLTESGTWFIVANSFPPNQFGPYTLTLACLGGPTPTPTVLPTSTPTPAAPREIPTLSFPMFILLALFLATLAIGVLRQL